MSIQAPPILETRPAPSPATAADGAWQDAILPSVSRTFALTIPALPQGLREVVTNAYLLCRIADSIEDDPALEPERRRRFHAELAELVEGHGDAEAFARELDPLFSSHTLEAERELVRDTPRVIRVARSFEPAQRAALARCVRVMCEGMPRFQDGRSGRGLADVAEFHEYCYYVAGCVGELLTELFCDHAPDIAAHRAELEARAVSFGQGLQMTNILKDVWDDRERGYCWLPRALFARHGFDLAELEPGRRSEAFESGLGELIGIAHGHLQSALEYTLAIPASHAGIRRFCLWALGMAVLTLRKLDANRDYRTSSEVKIKRSTVHATVWAGDKALASDRALRVLFALCATGLPPARVPAAANGRASGNGSAT